MNKSVGLRLITNVINKLYKKNTIFNSNLNTKHIEFSNGDLYILERLLELKFLLLEREN